MKRRIKLTGVLLLLVGALIFSRRLSRLVSAVAVEEKEKTAVVLDAGHGA